MLTLEIHSGYYAINLTVFNINTSITICYGNILVKHPFLLSSYRCGSVGVARPPARASSSLACLAAVVPGSELDRGLQDEQRRSWALLSLPRAPASHTHNPRTLSVDIVPGGEACCPADPVIQCYYKI